MTISTDRLADLLQALDSSMRPIHWTTPQDSGRHRALLREHALLRPEQRYPHPFTYPRVDPEPVLGVVRRLESAAADVEDLRLRALLLDHVDRASNRLRCIAERTDDTFTSVIARLDGLPSPDVLARAEALVAQSNPQGEQPRARLHPASDIIGRMRAALEAYNLSTWTVSATDRIAAGAVVTRSQRTVQIRSDLTCSDRQLDRLVVHEIGGHVLRTENASAQSHYLVSQSLGDVTATEEGLAALLEEEFAVSDPAQLRTYAARVLAVEISRTGGIIEVITALADRGVPLDGAVTIALRVKRGLTDPNRAGGATKDHSYLTGLVALRRLPSDDIDLLRCTKWPMKNLPLLRQIWADGDLAPVRFTARADFLGLSEAAPSRVRV